MSVSSYPLRFATPAQLAQALQQARQNTLSLFECFVRQGREAPAQVPRMAGLNPALWQLGHIAWFCEWYVLREAQTSHPASATRASLLSKGDDWFDANTVPHHARWTLGLPSTGALKTYCFEVLDRTLDKLSRTPNHDAALYPFRLALAHEDLCAEEMVCAMQLLGVNAPNRFTTLGLNSWAQGEIRFPGGSLIQGSGEGGFVFDNEQPQYTQHVPAFNMDSTLVSNAQFAEFVADGGYQRAQFWTPGGSAWLMQQERSAARFWQRENAALVSHDSHWVCQRFGRLQSLAPAEPVRHISLYEAQAYCAWAQRRLPSEAEWEFAAKSGHAALRWGDLWEWTSSAFLPYPNFHAGPWREYSQAAFHSHQVLRGASFATSTRLRSATMRQFALPSADHILCGFRTCAW